MWEQRDETGVLCSMGINALVLLCGRHDAETRWVTCNKAWKHAGTHQKLQDAAVVCDTFSFLIWLFTSSLAVFPGYSSFFCSPENSMLRWLQSPHIFRIPQIMRQTTFPGCVSYHRSLRLGQNIILCCDNSLSNNLHPSYTALTPT